MRYKAFKDKVLQLINQYSITGNEIALSYNAQSDYVLRIPALLDSAQKYLATTTAKIYASFPLDWEAAETRSGFYVVQMPNDFWQLCGRGLAVMQEGEFTAYHRYRWLGRDKIVVPIRDAADMEVQYYRYPYEVPAAPSDGYMLDNTPDAQDAAAYYVAAHLVMEDSPFLYSALYNEFENRRQQMFEHPQTEYDRIEDSYGMADLGIYGV
jgi:hypothetical protein